MQQRDVLQYPLAFQNLRDKHKTKDMCVKAVEEKTCWNLLELVPNNYNTKEMYKRAL